ncbi:GerAB/ArcD/ProY family transporter [Brevibacillus fluminis]|uniref:GerAB/ArcD/ProY family transporter n=1 Tax=Brevibacillus fluminis TaxID=511487 RepID=UPI003F887E7F
MIQKRISPMLLYCTIMLSIGISNHVLLIPLLLHVAKRDAWVGALLAFIPLLLWGMLLLSMLKRLRGRNLMEWIKIRYGPFLWLIITGLMACEFSLMALICFRDLVTWSQVTYLPRTPRIIVALTFIGICFFAARKGIRAIALSAGLLLPAVIVFGDFVAAANFQVKDYSLLLPVFTHGYRPTITAMLYTMSGLFEIMFILFIQHHVSKPLKPLALFLLSFILVMLTIGPLTGAIAIFGPFEAAMMRYPAFEQWRMVTLGKFISHLDFFSIYQWISGAFIRTSLMLYLTLDIIGLASKRAKTCTLTAICALFLVFIMIPDSDSYFLKRLEYLYFPISFGLILFVGLLLFALVMLAKGTEEHKS